MSNEFKVFLTTLSEGNADQLNELLSSISSLSNTWENLDNKARQEFLAAEKAGYDELDQEYWKDMAATCHQKFKALSEEQQKLFERVLLPELFEKLSSPPVSKPEENSKRSLRSWLIQILTTVGLSFLALRSLQQRGVRNARSGQLAFGLFALSNLVWTWLMRSKPPVAANEEKPLHSPVPSEDTFDTQQETQRKEEAEKRRDNERRFAKIDANMAGLKNDLFPSSSDLSLTSLLSPNQEKFLEIKLRIEQLKRDSGLFASGSTSGSPSFSQNEESLSKIEADIRALQADLLPLPSNDSLNLSSLLESQVTFLPLDSSSILPLNNNLNPEDLTEQAKNGLKPNS